MPADDRSLNPAMEAPRPGPAPDAASPAVERLRAGWTGERDLQGANLAGQDLSGLDLSGFDLSGADLSRADLSGCRMLGTRLRGTLLSESNLEGSELLNADLGGADLTECRAAGAGFGGACLDEATLFGARLSGTTFTRGSLRHADLRATDLERSRIREADLRGADLSRATLRAGELDQCLVDEAVFRDTDLREARLRRLSGHARARWAGVDIRGADFAGGYLARRTIMDQNFIEEFRNESRAHGILYWIWWATSDCGRSFIRWSLWIGLIAVVFAGLFEVTHVDFGPDRTPLASLYFSVVTLTTLGYGDITPVSSAAQLLAMIETVIGYVMLGGLLSIFATKMARRAE